MLLTKKKSGKVKGRLAYNGKPTRVWTSKEEKSSPTVLTESLFIICAIDLYEICNIMQLDIPNAFIQAGISKRDRGKRIIMKIRGNQLSGCLSRHQNLTEETWFWKTVRKSYIQRYSKQYMGCWRQHYYGIESFVLTWKKQDSSLMNMMPVQQQKLKIVVNI